MTFTGRWWARHWGDKDMLRQDYFSPGAHSSVKNGNIDALQVTVEMQKWRFTQCIEVITLLERVRGITLRCIFKDYQEIFWGRQVGKGI